MGVHDIQCRCPLQNSPVGGSTTLNPTLTAVFIGDYTCVPALAMQCSFIAFYFHNLNKLGGIMPRKSPVEVTFQNTYSGETNKRGEFIHDTDESGKWIKTNNLKAVGPSDYQWPKTISSKYLEDTNEVYGGSLKLTPGATYVLISTNSLEANEELDLDAVNIGFYKPMRPSVPAPQ